MANRYIFILFLLVCSGCESAEDKLFRSHYAASQYEAGTTHIAVLSAEPWADYADAIQPNFQLTGEQALQRTLPVTQLLSDQLLDAVNASLRISLPSITSTRTETRERELTEGDLITDTQRISEEERSGPNELPAQPAPAGGARTAAMLPNVPLNPTSLQREPILQYQTALALFQEVQNLNRYVKNATQRSGYTPYLVRIQVSVMPFARNQPYDIYADLAFMPPLRPKPANPNENQLAGYEIIPGVPDSRKQTYDSAKRHGRQTEVPIVIPLLVTDVGELSLQSRAAEIVRQLSAAASGQIQSIGFEGNLSTLRNEIAAALSNDFNALSTVGSVTTNVTRVRLGAAYQASSRYATLPRANTISLLILVPNESVVGYEARFMPVALRTRMRDATTGKLLDDIDALSRSRRSHEIAEIVRKFGIKDGASGTCGYPQSPVPGSEIVEALADATTQGSFEDFGRCAAEAKISPDFFDTLWIDVSGLRAGYGYATTDIQLRQVERPRLPPSQTALLLDDRSSSSTIRIAGASGFVGDTALAELRFSSGEIFRAQRVSRVTNDLIITFPSLAAWGITPQLLPKSPVINGAELVVSLPNHWQQGDNCIDIKRNNASPCQHQYRVAYRAKAAEPDPGFSIINTVSTVGVESSGRGIYRFAIKLTDAKSITLKGSGVLIENVTPASPISGDFAWEIRDSKVIEVTLAQLTPQQRFQLVLTGNNRQQRTIDLEAKALTLPRETRR